MRARVRNAAGAALLLFVTGSCGGSGGRPVADAAAKARPDASTGEAGPADAQADALADAGQATRKDAGGPADSGAGDSCLGTCLESFLAPCSKLGQSCVTQTAGSTVSTCYANGVKESATQTGDVTVSTFYGSDGQQCYVTTRTGLTDEDIKSPSGVLLGHITFDETQTHLTVTCYPNGSSSSPETTTADLTSPACSAYYTTGTEQCTAGTCQP